MRVLIVDDDEQIRRVLRINLETRGYSVVEALNGADAVAAAAEGVELIVLDLGLPDLSGADVVIALRALGTVPILVLSGRTESADKVDALDAGANDYVTKPFSIEELLARVRALTRAAVEETTGSIEFGGNAIDFRRHRVTKAGSAEVIRLTPTEWGMLEFLVRNADRLVSKRELLTAVWGPSYVREDSYLRLFVSQLRRKLEPEPSRPRHFLTEPGLGYRFSPGP